MNLITLDNKENSIFFNTYEMHLHKFEFEIHEGGCSLFQFARR